MATGRVPTTANSPLTAKGDLFGYSTTQARVAVGSDGDTLVADSAATTGLRWQGNYSAGKNKIINGDFSINQRAFTTSTSGTTSYTFDRWIVALSGATATYSAETFTPGAAPVAGYEATNFIRLAVTTGNDNARIEQKIEDVRTLAGQTVTVSFWAKGTNPTTAGNLKAILGQSFGTGGSSTVTESQNFVLTANWTRYSLTYTLGSLSGKTIGSGSYIYLSLGQGADVSTDAWTLDLWGVQVEAGNVSTSFQTATGTIQGELAACQRYLPAINGANYECLGFAYGTTGSQVFVKLPVTARVKPTGISVSNVSHFTLYTSGFASGNPTAIAINTASIDTASINVTTSAGSPTIAAKDPIKLQSTNASGLILFTGCEL